MKPQTLYLHAGMHKTASTYIQHRLRSNVSELAQQGILYPMPRSVQRALVKTLSKESFAGWDELLLQARELGQCPIISSEAFSVELIQLSRRNQAPLYNMLIDFLAQRGWNLTIIAFLRDQPSYLNSRYSQLVKRLYTIESFPKYVERVIRGGSESECNPMTLFSWMLDAQDVQAHIHPYGVVGKAADPFTQVLSCLPVNQSMAYKPLENSIVNVNPGDKGVWLARMIGRELKKNHPELWKSSRTLKQVRKHVERLSEQHGWVKDPFYGITAEVLAMIKQAYSVPNNVFAARAWGGRSWDDVFGKPSYAIEGKTWRENQAEQEEMQRIFSESMTRIVSKGAARVGGDNGRLEDDDDELS